MRYEHENGRVTGIRLAYIGGGSRGWAWKFMTDLALEPAMGGTVALYDIDRAAAEANRIIGGRIEALPETVGHWTYEVADTLEEALTGADFVVISILPGTFDEMEADVHVPEKWNIWQSVGDTAGPGGVIRALRTLPMFVPIAEGIRNCCPEAWVINYTNPMTLCVKMLYEVFPGIKAFGCCHEVFNTQEVLCMAVAEMLSVPRPARREIHVNVAGINHFTWFTEASWKGNDLFPLYTDFVNRHYEDGFHDPDKPWEASTFHCAHRVKFDLFRRYGAIAAAGDRHLAEFMPGDQYLKDPETVRAWKFGLTTVQWRKDELKERLARSRAMAGGTSPVELEPSGEEGILLMKALTGMTRTVSNVNLPNVGQIPNLPLGEVVETNAVFAKDSVKPVVAGRLPEQIRDLILPHTQIHALTLKAAQNCDREALLEALCLDPNVKAKCTDRAEIAAMAEEMLRRTRAYLPEGWSV